MSAVPEVIDVHVHVDPESGEDSEVQGHVAMVDPQRVAADATAAALAVPEVLEVTHSRVHVLREAVTVELTIDVDPSITVKEVYRIAQQTRLVVEALETVDEADVHLELDDHHHDGTPTGSGSN